MKFIDLFAGLGGFHNALEELGAECVFASEKKQTLRNLYEENFGIYPEGDITKVDLSCIPDHDILCAGFPCQPFSKAGMQNGLRDEKNGYLFDYIVEILRLKRPKYFILENVRNLEKHESGKTYKYIIDKLENELEYTVKCSILSPHNFGVPQHRERFFVVGSTDDIDHFEWPRKSKQETNIESILDSKYDNFDSLKLEEEKIFVLQLWQEFLERLPKGLAIPGPLWSMEFGATYPFEGETPYSVSSIKLGKSKGNFGVSLKGLSLNETFASLPSYARHEVNRFPVWKENFIRKNRNFYLEHGYLFNDLVPHIKNLGVPSWQKFEWNVKGGERNIFRYLIQFRGSGVRVKRTDYFPSLVTVSTQIPIVASRLRYLSIEEGKKLQSMKKLKMPDHPSSAFYALGNAVNSKVVKLVCQNLVTEFGKVKKEFKQLSLI
ncbi:DNA (cytosine-5)-methyltransferase 1 [Neolewinella xylanilytica]|uniref:Cytosine-specific methyltransferase n=1 Tax=Neolewinella xylanilytica TaxID=1514080 RepID=A0A2S6I1D4_9BACT|nr:DNA (cytosine-5-)-methyltransferase [Neolewinella xylanilytica]PPK84762.1 DNA (cytosine-5)-methyltransferase 1 [Neolewinella xylanilytica]